MSPHTFRPFYLLFGTALGGGVSIHVQFGGFPSSFLEELEITLLVVLVAACANFLVFWPLARVVERHVSPSWYVVALFSACIASSVGLGFWFYAGFLPRSIDTALSRDLSHVLSFALLGLGFALARVATSHLTLPLSGRPPADAHGKR